MYSSPPPVKQFSEAKPTLLVAWWTTLFCTCLILLRLTGRYIRIERLLFEDKVAAGALLPLYLRIACAHIVLFYGTNNGQFEGSGVSPAEVEKRVTGSRVVLAERVFYTATLWTLKFATLEFLRPLAGASNKKLFQRFIIGLRGVLVATFIGVLVTIFVECQPFGKYWQVLPDPGPKCRQGFAQLVAVGVSSAFLDSVLAFLPVPIIISTSIPTKRKILLVLLFGFGFLTVGISAYRIPASIDQHGDQVIRSMWDSVELLAATTVTNLIALGSFLRNSSARKIKFRPEYHSSERIASSRRPRQGMASGEAGAEPTRYRQDEGDDWMDEDMVQSRRTVKMSSL